MYIIGEAPSKQDTCLLGQRQEYVLNNKRKECRETEERIVNNLGTINAVQNIDTKCIEDDETMEMNILEEQKSALIGYYECSKKQIDFVLS